MTYKYIYDEVQSIGGSLGQSLHARMTTGEVSMFVLDLLDGLMWAYGEACSDEYPDELYADNVVLTCALLPDVVLEYLRDEYATELTVRDVLNTYITEREAEL